MQIDWLIVGAGLAGVTLAERIASQCNESVIIVDQRDHVGGNVYDEYNKHGVLIQKYGPHIFHTNDQEVFNYLSQFTAWRPYQHKVLGQVEGHLVPLPFNLNSIDALFSPSMATRFVDKLIGTYGYGANVSILQLREVGDADLKLLADYVYRNVFENYTKKQWGMTPEELSPSVTARVPIRVSRDDRYFQDKYQAMPSEGYAIMVKRMLAHPNIRIMLNTPWEMIKGEIRYKHLAFTGSVDEFFDFKHGALPYRSLRFEMQTYNVARYQSVAVVNFPNDYDYTRITEQKLLTGQRHSQTTIIYEYPINHVTGETIPYYPIPKNITINFGDYQTEIANLKREVVFAGRLAQYRYFNMDEAVKNSINIAKNIKDSFNV